VAIGQVKHPDDLLAFAIEDNGLFHEAAILGAAFGVVNAPLPGYIARLIMPILTDYHIHTPLCRHAAGPMEACVERAIELGLREIGFACHNPLPRGLGSGVRMEESELDYYVRRVTDLQFQYRGKIDVLLGLEMEYVEGLEDYLARQASAYPWDYLIGSIHYLDPECKLFAWSRWLPFDAEEQYLRYFALIEKLVASGRCDIVSHFDVPRRSGNVPGPLGTEAMWRALDAVARAGLCLEINTSGYRHPDLPTPDAYPLWPVIERALALDIPLAVNSDAHGPDQVGLMFPAIEELLWRKGCRRLSTFRQRKRGSYFLRQDTMM
jgi:histidinol-phosphatase (PHP family)